MVGWGQGGGRGQADQAQKWGRAGTTGATNILILDLVLRCWSMWPSCVAGLSRLYKLCVLTLEGRNLGEDNMPNSTHLFFSWPPAGSDIAIPFRFIHKQQNGTES